MEVADGEGQGGRIQRMERFIRPPDGIGVFDRDDYEMMVVKLDLNLIPHGANAADWDYDFISRHLYMVMHNYLEAEPKRVIAESSDKCGFQAYILLSRDYGPTNADTEHMLLQRVLNIANWTVKGRREEHAVLREAHIRIKDMERRSLKKDVPEVQKANR